LAAHKAASFQEANLKENSKARMAFATIVRSSKPTDRLFLLRIVVTIGYVVGIIISWRLWLSDRDYPLTPVFSWLPGIPSPIDALLPAGLCLLLITHLFVKNKQPLILASLIVVIVLALFDQSRWQPWFYQYSLMLFSLLSIKDEKNDISATDVLNISRLIIICIYVWSGLHKFNSYFYDEITPWMIDGVIPNFPSGIVSMIAHSIPFIEIAIGILLFFKRTRTAAIIGAIGSHLFVLLTLGPLGRHQNQVIIPWNLVMIAFVLILFKKDDIFSLRSLLVGRSFQAKLIALLVVVMPILNAFNRWDSYLSFALFSGNIAKASYYITPEGYSELPINVRPYCIKDSASGMYLIDVIDWTDSYFHASLYPEPRIYESVANYLAKDLKKGEMLMVHHERITPFISKPSIRRQYP
jgi:hypothetical protein